LEILSFLKSGQKGRDIRFPFRLPAKVLNVPEDRELNLKFS
jgi:hypothetical protein